MSRRFAKRGETFPREVWRLGCLFFWICLCGGQIPRDLCQKGRLLKKGLEFFGDASRQKTELGGVHPESPGERREPFLIRGRIALPQNELA